MKLGAFTNYVDKFRAIFWPPTLPAVPSYIDIFYLISVDKKSTFLGYLPTSFCQRSLWRLWHIWSPTIGPQLIGASGQMVPSQFGPHGQMVPKNSVPLDKWSPTNLVPLDKWSLEYSVCLGCGDLEIRGPNWLGTICPGGPNFGGPFVHGDRIWWGPWFVQGDRFYGDLLSRGTGSGGLEVRGSNLFGTKCVAALWMDNCRRSYDFFLLANLVVKIHIFHGNIKISSIQNLIYIDSIFIALVWLDLGISFLSKYRVVPKPAYIDAVFDPNWNVSCRYNTFCAMCVCCHPFFVSCTL